MKALLKCVSGYVEKHLRTQWLFIAIAIHCSKTKFEMCLFHWLIRNVDSGKKSYLTSLLMACETINVPEFGLVEYFNT